MAVPSVDVGALVVFWPPVAANHPMSQKMLVSLGRVIPNFHTETNIFGYNPSQLKMMAKFGYDSHQHWTNRKIWGWFRNWLPSRASSSSSISSTSAGSALRLNPMDTVQIANLEFWKARFFGEGVNMLFLQQVRCPQKKTWCAICLRSAHTSILMSSHVRPVLLFLTKKSSADVTAQDRNHS